MFLSRSHEPKGPSGVLFFCLQVLNTSTFSPFIMNALEMRNAYSDLKDVFSLVFRDFLLLK